LLFILLLVRPVVTQTDCPTAPASPQDRRTDRTKLSIVSFNAEWLFLYRSNCPGTGCPWSDINAARNHLNNIGNTLGDINADIVVIEEVESCTVLVELLATSALSSKGYKPYMIRGTDTATGQNVGLITKVDPKTNLVRTAARYNYPIAGNTCGYNGSPGNAGVSKHFYTTFQIAGLSKPLLLVGLHFLAFPTTSDRCVEREAQASVIRDIVNDEGLSKNYEVVVLGDFNDYDPSVIDEAKSVPTSRVLNIIKGSELVNVARYHPNRLTGVGIYSSWYDKNSNCIDDKGAEHTAIDHILITSNLASKIRTMFYYFGYTASCGSFMSDHWPVVIEVSTTGTANLLHSQPHHEQDTNTNQLTAGTGSTLLVQWQMIAVVTLLFVLLLRL